MDYDAAVEVVKKAEAYDTEQRSISIDLTDLNETMPIKEFNSKEVTTVLNFLDKMEGRPVNPERPAVQVQSMQVQFQQMQSQTTQTVRKAGIMKDLEAAAEEFQDAVSNIEGSIESVTEKKSTSKLILPNLSINDQLSELEKINLGLDGSVFDQDQLKIIKEEVKGLSKSVGRKKKGAAAGASMDVEDLRNTRLKEVLSKLGVK